MLLLSDSCPTWLQQLRAVPQVKGPCSGTLEAHSLPRGRSKQILSCTEQKERAWECQTPGISPDS